MNRSKLVEIILNAKNISPKDALVESLKYIEDMQLYAFAASLGIDINSVWDVQP